MTTQKPNDGVKAKIYGLKPGLAYPIQELSDEWGVSPETIRSHAKRYDALRWIEVTTANWVQCVLHPDSVTEG